VQTVEYADKGLQNLALFAIPGTPQAFSGSLEPSSPAQARLRVDVDGTIYAITVRITKDPARPVPAPLEIYEREPVIAEYGLHGLLDPELAFVVLHTARLPATKVKKWATPTFSGL